MSIVSKIGEVINKMTVASSIDYFIVEREFANLLSASKDYQVFIDAPLISEGTVNSGVFLRTYQVKMLWLKKEPLGNTYAQHYDNAITVMRTLVKEFILRLNNEKDNVTQAAIFEPVTQVRETDIINLFDQNTSGVLIEFNLKVINDNSICTPNVLPPPSVYLFADLTNVSTGTQIRLGWIAFNVDTITIDNGIGTVSAIGSGLVTIDNTILFTATATNSNGTATDKLTISVSNGCDDATAELFNTNGNLLSTTQIPSGATEPIIAPDGVVTIENTTQTFQVNKSVLSGGVAAEVLPDTDIEVYVDGVLQATSSVPTLENNTINIVWQ